METKFEACKVTCAGFYGDVQKEIPELTSGKDFSRLEDLTTEYNQWKATFSKNLVFNSSATDFSEPKITKHGLIAGDSESYTTVDFNRFSKGGREGWFLFFGGGCLMKVLGGRGCLPTI